MDWKQFERFVAEIFRSHSFKVKHGMRFKTKRKYEIDLLAVRGEKVFCVDCKSWSMGRYKNSALRKAARMQEERILQFKKYMWKNLILHKILNVNPSSEFHSLIVTAVEETIVNENQTYIVPVVKLNTFLLEAENYL